MPEPRCAVCHHDGEMHPKEGMTVCFEFMCACPFYSPVKP